MSLDKLNNYTVGTSKPLLCLEINPPKGTDTESVFSRLEGNLGGVDFLNVTDCALAKMRSSGLIFGALLKQRFGIEPLVNLSCRDRNLIALQSDLLGAWSLGVRSVIALTGDAVTVGDDPERKGVFEVNSVGLLGCINTLNSGKDLVGNELKGKPDFVSGVVVNPNAKNVGAEVRRLEKKLKAGARYALSQPVFDEESSYEFFSAVSAVKIPIFMGLMPVKTRESALAIGKVPGIKMSDKLMAEFDNAKSDDLSEYSIEHCLKLAERNRNFVVGFHVISGAAAKLGLRLAGRLSDFIRGL
jgi:5,10-methylenetetrahydrofolate reductase